MSQEHILTIAVKLDAHVDQTPTIRRKDSNIVLAELKSFKEERTSVEQDLEWVYRKLNTLSRSFAFVIMELPDKVRDVVALFYLILRALDTIEDDAAVESSTKEKHLNTFFQHLSEPGWNLKGYGSNSDEIDLLQNFDKLINCLLKLDSTYLEIISKISREMGLGMKKFVGCGGKIISVSEYDEYCYYVAGLVGLGLTDIWIASGLEKSLTLNFEVTQSRSKSLGLLLQKVNIIRDIKDDMGEGRSLWPEEIWRNYVAEYSILFHKEFETVATQCLNHLVSNALSHVLDSLDYLLELKNPAVFRFCAIPALMAITTLKKCYNNYNVFEDNVKIPRKKVYNILEKTKSPMDLLEMVRKYLEHMLSKIMKQDPNASELESRIHELVHYCNEKIQTLDLPNTQLG